MHTGCGNNYKQIHFSNYRFLMESQGGGGGVHLTWVDSNTGEVNIVDHVGDDDNSSDGSDQITVI